MTRQEIINECLECIWAWKEDNGNEPVDIDYEDYTNFCYNYGGSELHDELDALINEYGDEGLQDFYDQISFKCERENVGIRSAIGQRIRHLRLRNGWTQDELSAKAGITRANLSNIEVGKYSVGLDVLDRIAKALGVEILLD